MVYDSFFGAIIEKFLADIGQFHFLLWAQALGASNQAQGIALSDQSQIGFIQCHGCQNTRGLAIGAEQHIFVNWAIEELLFGRLFVDTLREQCIEFVL